MALRNCGISAPYDPVVSLSGLNERLRSFTLFGFAVTTNFPFTTSLATCSGPVNLTFERSPQLVLAVTPQRHALIYESPIKAQNGASLTCLYKTADHEVLRFHKAGDFLVHGNRITAHLPEPHLELAELRFLGPVLSYWFELRGLPTLHSSAVAVNGRAVAFISRHGGGKSGLAAAMVRAGFPLLTDDLLVLEERETGWEARPAYPEMRMWPDEAAHFVGPTESLPLVQADSEKRRVAIGDGGFGSFRDAAAPLACIYLASRRQAGEGDIEIQPVSRSEALIELVRHSFSPRLVEAASLQPARLDRLARLVRAVPVRRLVYPSGFDRLPEVVKLLRQ